MYQGEYPHQLTRDEALARIRALTDYWDAAHATRTEWRGNQGVISGKVLGISFTAWFTVDDHTVHGEMQVSFLAVQMGGKQYLKRKLDHYLNPEIASEALVRV